MPYRDPEERRAHNVARRCKYREWLHALNATQICDACGGEVRLWHHVDPTTRWFLLSQGFGYCVGSIAAELEKCIPMCNPCHTRFHNANPTA